MKVRRTLKVNEQEFYDYLEKEIVSEINQYSQKNICATDIKKGVKYTKNMDDKHSKIDISIENYVRGYIYKFKVKTLTDNILISYETKPTTDGHVEVTFLQNIDSFEENQKNKLFKSFSTAFYLGRMCDKLYDIQNKIINERDGNVVLVQSPSPNGEYSFIKKLFQKKI